MIQLRLKIGEKELLDNTLYTFSQVNLLHNPISLDLINLTVGQYYTICFIDEDPAIGKTKLHMLYINTTKDFYTNILEYTPPNPPIYTGLHRYRIMVFLQNDIINTDSYLFVKSDPYKFNIIEYIIDNRLKLETALTFYIDTVKQF